jgi:anti-anti-sigma factor
VTSLKCPGEVAPFAILQSSGADGATTVQVLGELDLATSPGLGIVLTELAARRSATTLDLSRTAFMDCTGLAVLVRASRLAERDGWAFALAAERSVSVQRLLRGTSVDDELGYDQVA